MNYSQINTLKQTYQTAMSSMDTIQQSVGSVGGMNLSDILRLGLVQFVFRLVAADGTVANDEARTFGEIFGGDFTSSSLMEMMKNVGVGDDIPIIFKVTVEIDKALASEGMSAGLSQVILQTYEMFGTVFIEADGNNDPRELAAKDELLNKYKRFVRAGLL